MKDSLIQGLTVTRRFTIDEARTIDFLDAGDTAGEGARVYATPSLVRDIETTCRDLMLEHLDPGEDSLGTRVDIAHLAPTLLNMWVDITVTLDKLEGRAATFEIAVGDPVDKSVASGRHDRFVIDVAKTKERLAAKAEQAAAAA